MAIADGQHVRKMRYILYGHDPNGYTHMLMLFRERFAQETGCSIVDIVKARIEHAHSGGDQWYSDPMHPHNIY